MLIGYGTIHLRRRHALGGEGCPPLPTFADARGGGVLRMPTSTLCYYRNYFTCNYSLIFWKIHFFSFGIFSLFVTVCGGLHNGRLLFPLLLCLQRIEM